MRTNGVRLGILLKFVALPGQEQRLYCSATFWLLSVKAGLYLLPFSRINGWLTRLAHLNTQPAQGRKPQTVVRAIERISRALPRWRITCLPQAMVGYLLLRRQGFDVCLKIGVCKDATEQLTAHAWLEYQGRVLLGDLDEINQFIPVFMR